MNIKSLENVPVSKTNCLLKPSNKRAKYRQLAAIKSFVGGGEEGGALVELGLTLPILCVIITGIFSFSLALYQKLELAQAVGAGGRFLAVDINGDADPCASTAAKVYASAPGLNPTNMTFTFSGSGNGTSMSYPAGTSPKCGSAVLTTGGTVTVQVSYPCTLSVYGLSLTACSLNSQVTEVLQ
jgi:Flp pilus assembly protein TadG